MSRSIIAIAGASASGKTLFAQTVYKELLAELEGRPLAVLEEDAYYRDQSHLEMSVREQTNYDHPKAFEHELLVEHILALKSGKDVDVPVYDFANHTRGAGIRHVQAAEFVIVEGILLLSDPALRQLFDVRVFIDTPLDICLLRRIERDTQERGRSFQSVAEQYKATVRPMYYEHIEPSKQHAHIVVTGGGRNRVAIDMVKEHIKSSLRQITI
ncbi:MAG: uridine kinase [Arenicella sp.]|nr:uridine kinase [Arenicella sp.]